MLVSFSLSFSPVLVFLIPRFYSSHIVKTEGDVKSRSTNSLRNCVIIDNIVQEQTYFLIVRNTRISMALLKQYYCNRCHV